MRENSSLITVGPCYCNDGGRSAGVVYRVHPDATTGEAGGLQLRPLVRPPGGGYPTRPAPVGLTGADRVVCLNTFGGVAWAHLSSSAQGQACLVRLEAPDDLVPVVTIDHTADPDPGRAFAQAGIDLAEYEWRDHQ